MQYIVTEEGKSGYCICTKAKVDFLHEKLMYLFLKFTLGHCSCKMGALSKEEPGAKIS